MNRFQAYIPAPTATIPKITVPILLKKLSRSIWNAPNKIHITIAGINVKNTSKITLIEITLSNNLAFLQIDLTLPSSS